MQMNRLLAAVLLSAALGLAQMPQGEKKGPPKGPPQSPPAETSVAIAGKNIAVKYSAPSMRGRKIFGSADALQKPNTMWRAGANQATALHTDADLDLNGTVVPKGDYTLFVWLDEGKWELIVNKQTGQWGIKRGGDANFDEAQNAARVPLTMSKPSAPIEQFKIALTSEGGNKGKLQLEWENVIASLAFTVK